MASNRRVIFELIFEHFLYNSDIGIATTLSIEEVDGSVLITEKTNDRTVRRIVSLQTAKEIGEAFLGVLPAVPHIPPISAPRQSWVPPNIWPPDLIGPGSKWQPKNSDCLFENLPESMQGTPLGLSCPCGKCAITC